MARGQSFVATRANTEPRGVRFALTVIALGFLAAYDFVFLVAAWGTYDFLVSE